MTPVMAPSCTWDHYPCDNGFKINLKYSMKFVHFFGNYSFIERSQNIVHVELFDWILSDIQEVVFSPYETVNVKIHIL